LWWNKRNFGREANLVSFTIYIRRTSRYLEFSMVGDILTNLKQEFRNRNNKLVKIVKLKKVDQEGKMIKEYIQKLKRRTRMSRYEERPLIKKFKRGLWRQNNPIKVFNSSMSE